MFHNSEHIDFTSKYFYNIYAIICMLYSGKFAMTKNKIFYSLCIAALGLPFAEAMDRKQNICDNCVDKPIKSPLYNPENLTKVCKKLVRKEDGQNYRSQKNHYYQQCKVFYYDEYEWDYCNLIPKSYSVHAKNHRECSGDEVEMMVFIYNKTKSYTTTSDILNILAKSDRKSLEHLNKKTYYPVLVAKVVKELLDPMSVLMRITKTVEDKLKNAKSATNNKTLYEDIIEISGRYDEYRKRNDKIIWLASTDPAELKELDEANDCAIFSKINMVDVNGNVLEADAVKAAVYLRNVKMLSYEYIAKVLNAAYGITCAFSEYEAIFKYAEADKIWRRDITDSIMQVWFKKLKNRLAVWRTNNVEDQSLIEFLIRDLDDNPYEAVRNTKYRNKLFTYEQIKIIKCLKIIGLTAIKATEIFNSIFNSGGIHDIDDMFNSNICATLVNMQPSDPIHFFYEIDKWLYLSEADKERLKDQLLECQITWQKTAKFLYDVCSFEPQDAAYIINEIFSKVSSYKEIDGNEIVMWKHYAKLSNITNKNLMLDLEYLGLLNEICSYLDGSQKKAFMNKLNDIAVSQ